MVKSEKITKGIFIISMMMIFGLSCEELTSGDDNESKSAVQMQREQVKGGLAVAESELVPADDKVLNTASTYYRIRSSMAPSKVVDVYGGGTYDGANAILWQWHGGYNQQWRFDYLGNGYYRVVARHSGLVLDVQWANTSVGGNVWTWPWNGSSAQWWKLYWVPSAGRYALQALCSGLYLDAYGYGDGTNVQQWKWDGNAAQLWYIEAVAWD